MSTSIGLPRSLEYCKRVGVLILLYGTELINQRRSRQWLRESPQEGQAETMIAVLVMGVVVTVREQSD